MAKLKSTKTDSFPNAGILIAKDLIAAINLGYSGQKFVGPKFLDAPIDWFEKLQKGSNINTDPPNPAACNLASFIIFLSNLSRPQTTPIFKYISENLSPQALPQLVAPIFQIGLTNQCFVNETKRLKILTPLITRFCPRQLTLSDDFLNLLYTKSLLQLNSSSYMEFIEKYLTKKSLNHWNDKIKIIQEKINLSDTINQVIPIKPPICTPSLLNKI